MRCRRTDLAVAFKHIPSVLPDLVYPSTALLTGATLKRTLRDAFILSAAVLLIGFGERLWTWLVANLVFSAAARAFIAR